MGCSLSWRSKSPGKSSPFDCIRVVHLNGFVEDFAQPTTVSQVTGKLPTHFLCSPSQLLSPGSLPLALEVPLQPGQFYFLLPLSVFESNASPVGLASLVARLTAAAERGSSPITPPSRNGSFRSHQSPMLGRNFSAPTVYSLVKDSLARDQASSRATYMERMGSRVHSWKPILEAIEERSFGRQSELDSCWRASHMSLEPLRTAPVAARDYEQV